MTFVKAGAKYEFEAKAVGITKGAPAKFKISAYPQAGAKVLAEGDEKAGAGGVTHKWKAEGPPTTDPNGVRSWRVAYEVTVDVPRDGATTQLKAPSQEVDVFHDWIELKTVKEDGSAYPNAVFDVVVTSAGREVQRVKAKSTGKTGIVKVTGLQGGDVAVVFKSPHLLVSWTSGTGCKLEAKVRAVPKATLVWPKPDAKKKHVQWVNLPADAAKKEQGSKCKLTFRLEGQVKAGDPVYVKTGYQAATNSPRDSHVRGIVSPDAGPPAWAGAAPNTGKKLSVAARNGGFEVDVEVECGIAGMDSITVAAGATEACTEVNFSIVTRRKIKLEELKPKDTLSTLASKGSSADLLKAYAAGLDAGGISHELDTPATYDVADLPDPKCVFDGAYFGRKAGTKVVVLNPDQFLNLKAKAAHGADAAGLTGVVMWADHIASYGYGAQHGTALKQIWLGESGTKRWTWNAATVQLPYNPKDPTKSAILSIKWCSVAYQQDGQWVTYKEEGTDVGVAGANGPGGSKSGWTDVPITDANLTKYVKFIDWRTIHLTCPDSDGPDPGNFIISDDGYPVAILIQFEIYWASFGELIAIAKDGLIGMTTGGGEFTTSGLAEIMLHETGHNLGLGLIDRANGEQPAPGPGGKFNYGQGKAPPSGPIPGLKFDEVDEKGKKTGTKLEWPQPVPNGVAYVGKQQLGPHCATGLKLSQRKALDFTNFDGKCLMFGSTIPTRKTVRTYCPQCTAILRGRDVSDMRRKWPVP